MGPRFGYRKNLYWFAVSGGDFKKIAEGLGVSYRLANPQEEAAGIDGFIGNLPVSIKPETYKTKDGLHEDIEAGIVFYKKVKDGIVVDVEEVLKKME